MINNATNIITASPTNCQVCFICCVYFLRSIAQPVTILKVSYTLGFVSMSSFYAPRSSECNFRHLPDLRIHRIRLLYPVASTPHVSVYTFTLRLSLRGGVHGFVSVAIWNRNKFVVVLVTITWVTNLSFLIQGKSLSTRFEDKLRQNHNHLFIRCH